jgi:cysteine desulfurase
MERIYLDNAATTPLDPKVLESMMPYLTNKYGNPSSIYSYGREARLAIEQARKTVAAIINAKPAEVFFTSGGTESSNTAINAAVYDLNCKHIITSAIEHHATLHTVQYIAKQGDATISYVRLLPDGHVDMHHLEELLQQSSNKTLVTLMHGNNEIGNILDINKVGQLCEQYKAIFHSDTVQTLAHYPLDVKAFKAHFITGSAHKFHGPKGVGLLYVSEHVTIQPLLQGGGQERNMRAGTENLYGIVGFATALQLATDNYIAEREHISTIKKYYIEQLGHHLPQVIINGDAINGLYTVLNVGFPPSNKTEMLLYSLDVKGICVSGGSACSSGSNNASHVIAALSNRQQIVPIRFSFSKYTTTLQVDVVIDTIKQLI